MSGTKTLSGTQDYISGRRENFPSPNSGLLKGSALVLKVAFFSCNLSWLDS